MNKIASLIGQNLRRSTREITNILHILHKSVALHLKRTWYDGQMRCLGSARTTEKVHVFKNLKNRDRTYYAT